MVAMIAVPLHTDHARLFEHNRFVYPVLSRRCGGISIGVNLNPDKVCNFDCIYCQVDRTQPKRNPLRRNRRAARRTAKPTLDLVTSGEIFEHRQSSRRHAATLRRLNDIAFSGDGEPTTYRNFDEIIAACAEREAAAAASTPSKWC